MSGFQKKARAPEKEAAVWHARLGSTSVATATVEEFFAWHAIPENADAYRRVDKVWRESGAHAADPVLARALAEARSRARRRPSRGARSRTFIGLGVAVAGAVCLAVGGIVWQQGRGVYETELGQSRVIALADGSEVTLDTGTRLQVRMERGVRRIRLDRGQALFSVAHDPARPFVVQAGDTSVVAVGTVFDVQRKGGEVDVTLVSGVVDVALKASPARKTRMAAGNQARVSTAGVTTRAVDTRAETGWVRGRLIFEDTPLAEAVGEINRYLPQKIVIGDPALGAVPVNGLFRTGDRDAFVAAASDALDLQATALADGSVRLTRRAK